MKSTDSPMFEKCWCSDRHFEHLHGHYHCYCFLLYRLVPCCPRPRVAAAEQPSLSWPIAEP
eukprot:14911040-Heterocapsa_arctica.AAC.1